MAYWSGRPGWLRKLGVILLIAWLFVLFSSVSQVFKNNFVPSSDSNNSERENALRLAQMAEDFELLKQQNQVLRNIILNEGSKFIHPDHLSSLKEKLGGTSGPRDGAYSQIGLKNEVPSLEYEDMRRKIKNNVQEMWYYISSELDKYSKHANDMTIEQRNTEIPIAIKGIQELKKSITLSIEKLTKIDGYNDWREKESKDLSDLVQRRFRYLQNPSNCDKAKKLVCSLNKGCGFGCQLHHITYCFLVAYGTERTLILKSKGWKYHKDGWESVFQPLSDTCISPNGDSRADWPGDESTQVINLPIVDSVYPKPKYQPPGVPADIAPRLEKLHGHPLVWWVGQVLKYLMRPQESVQKLLNSTQEKMGFKKPIVGIHVRRTDKVGTEAAYHHINEYMTKVEQYFDGLDVQPDVRRVFIASDDPQVITSARSQYASYEIIGSPEIAETASVSKRYSHSSLQGIIIDIHLLALCDYLICTFSSQVCRVAYELMQNYYPDAYDRFASLDDIYYYGGQNPHPAVVTLNHDPRKSNEIELRVGDAIKLFGNHWNGFSKGYNIRTNVRGLFPSFKVKNTIDPVEFPKYENVPLS